MGDLPRTALVVASGEVSDLSQLVFWAERAHLTVAADGGGRHFRAARVRPHLVVGDLDSISADTLQWCLDGGAQVESYPSDKDATDLQLAIAECLVRGAARVVILGALGGRLDHSLGNVGLLESLSYAGVVGVIVDGLTEVSLVGPEARFEGHAGDGLSLIPLDMTVSGVSTSGLRYALAAGVLRRGGVPSGVSNQFTQALATVRVEAGALLAIHTRQPNV